MEEAIYEKIAAMLLERIGAGDYFNGSVSVEAGGVEVDFRCTLIIYRDKEAGAIGNVVPVWWEFSVREHGKEIDNNLGWAGIKSYLLCARS